MESPVATEEVGHRWITVDGRNVNLTAEVAKALTLKMELYESGNLGCVAIDSEFNMFEIAGIALNHPIIRAALDQYRD